MKASTMGTCLLCSNTGSVILETDSAAVANRVTRTRPDTIEVQLNEQSTCLLSIYHTHTHSLSDTSHTAFMNAYTNFRDKYV